MTRVWQHLEHTVGHYSTVSIFDIFGFHCPLRHCRIPKWEVMQLTSRHKQYY
jgi:hypothetical protein